MALLESKNRCQKSKEHRVNSYGRPAERELEKTYDPPETSRRFPAADHSDLRGRDFGEIVGGGIPKICIPLVLNASPLTFKS